MLNSQKTIHFNEIDPKITNTKSHFQKKGHQNLAAFNYWNKNKYLFFQFSIFYQIVVEKRDGLNAFEKRVEREVLVWRMNGIAIQTKTH